jgi:hypothetical protein
MGGSGGGSAQGGGFAQGGGSAQGGGFAQGGGTATGGGGNGDTGGGGGTMASGPCPPELGSARVGAKWVYTFETTGASGSETVTVTQAQPQGTALLLTIVTELQEMGTSFSYDSTSTMHERCDSDGLTVTDGHTDYNETTTQGPTSASFDTVYSPAFRSLPASLAATPTWTTSGTVTTSTGTSSPTSSTYSYTSTVTGTEPVQVPAGSFNATIIHTDYGTSSADFDYVPGVGLVRSATTVLQSYSP